MKRIILLCLVSIFSMTQVFAQDFSGNPFRGNATEESLLGEWELLESKGEFNYPHPNASIGLLKRMTLNDCGWTILEFKKAYVWCNGFIITGVGQNQRVLHVFPHDVTVNETDGRIFNMKITGYDYTYLRLETYDGKGVLLMKRKKSDSSAIEKVNIDVKGDGSNEAYNVKGVRITNPDKVHGVIIKKDGEKVYNK